MFEGFKRMRDNKRLSSLYKKDKFTPEEEKFVLNMIVKSGDPISIFESINPNALTVGICNIMYGFTKNDNAKMHRVFDRTPASVIAKFTDCNHLFKLCEYKLENFESIDHESLRGHNTKKYFEFIIKFGEHIERLVNAFRNTYLRDPDERANRDKYESFWNSYKQNYYLPVIKESSESENRIQETIDMIYGKDEDNTEEEQEESNNGKGEAAKQVIENSNHIDNEGIDHPDDIDDDNVSN